MRFATGLGGVLLLVALGAACDSSQPLQVSEQTLEISFQAVNAVTTTFDVWDLIEDNDGDFVADDGQVYLWCEAVGASLPPVTVPWNYSVEISVIRAGQTVAEVITSPEARAPDFNVALYDTTEPFLGLTPARAPRCTSGGMEISCPGDPLPAGVRRFRFGQPRRERGSNIDLMRATSNPLDDMLGGGLGQGLCSEGNPGAATVDGMPQPFPVTIGKGDTVIVKAALAAMPPAGPGLRDILILPANALGSSVTLDGRKINVVGSTSGRTVSFSYTSR